MLNSVGADQYLRVSRIISDSLHVLSSNSGIEIKNLLKNISESNLDINYDKLSYSFTKEYWLRNYWKAVYYFEYKSKPLTVDFNREGSIEVLILGAGSAADTIACLVWLNKTFKLKNKILFTLVDRSQKQLDIAQKLLEKVKPEISNIKFDVKYEKVDIKNWKPIANSTDLLLMSHFLTENPEELDDLLDKAKLAVREKAQIVTIERERDKVWQRTRDRFMDIGIPVVDMKVYKDELVNLLKSVEDEKSDLITMTPHYLLAKFPDDKYQVDMVVKFFRAWRGQSIELVKEIFSKNAKFYEKAIIDPPMTGLKSIKGYWEENPMLQKDIQVKAKRVSYEAGYTMCEFGGYFDTPKQHVSIQGMMVLDIDQRTRQIKELREYFNTIKTPFS